MKRSQKANAERNEESSITSTARMIQNASAGLESASTFSERPFSERLSEELSCFLNQTYSTRNRAFHDIYHAHQVAEGCSPAGTFAALFHDVVYLQVDRARLPELRKLFSVFDPGDAVEVTVPSQECLQKDPWMGALALVFGVDAGDKLGPSTGVNEFLSAWVAICKLREHVGSWSLLCIIGAIEATIPFRGPLKNGATVSAKLLENIKKASALLGLKPTAKQLSAALADAVCVANQDVIGFGKQAPDVFIHNSWALLFESNPSLQGKFYSVAKYREALSKMERFFEFLNAKFIFRSFEGNPSSTEIAQLTAAAQRNLTVGKLYIRAKLVDTCFIEAIAQMTGGDAPLEMFLGTKPSRRESECLNVERFLDRSIPRVELKKKNQEVLELLIAGRADRSNFDIRTSPLAGYVYERLTASEFETISEQVHRFASGDISPTDYINHFKVDLAHAMTEAIAKVSWSRRKMISPILEFLRARKNAA